MDTSNECQNHTQVKTSPDPFLFFLETPLIPTQSDSHQAINLVCTKTNTGLPTFGEKKTQRQYSSLQLRQNEIIAKFGLLFASSESKSKPEVLKVLGNIIQSLKSIQSVLSNQTGIKSNENNNLMTQTGVETTKRKDTQSGRYLTTNIVTQTFTNSPSTQIATPNSFGANFDLLSESLKEFHLTALSKPFLSANPQTELLHLDNSSMTELKQNTIDPTASFEFTFFNKFAQKLSLEKSIFLQKKQLYMRLRAYLYSQIPIMGNRALLNFSQRTKSGF